MTRPPVVPSLAADLLRLDATTPAEPDELLDTLWPAICDVVSITDQELPPAVHDWFWTRLSLEEADEHGLPPEVDPDEHATVTAAWRSLCRPDVARLFERAVGAGDTKLDALDDNLEALADDLDALHVAHLRAHRDVFLALLAPLH